MASTIPEGSERSEMSSKVVQSLNEELERLSLPYTTRKELSDCIESIVKVDFRKLQHADKNSDSNSNFDSAIKYLMQFSSGIAKVIGQVEHSPGPVGTLCKVATNIVGLYFMQDKDITSIVARRFESILDDDLRAKCRATCIKISHCINYMQGLPNPSTLRDEDKKIHLLLMATDVPVQTGLDEVLYLGEKIRKMVDTAASDMSKFECLMNNVELYCCLATFREMFLLYRFAFQSMLEVNAQSVKNVLQSQVANDKTVLEFLYKPNVENVKLYYNARQGNWPLSSSFCERPELVAEDLGCLNKGVYKMQSVQSRCMLQPYEGSGMFGSHKQVDGVFLELNRRKRNVFSIQSDSQYIGVSECTNYVGFSDEKVRWYILKVHGNTSSEKPCFLIWLDTDVDKCMCNNSILYKSLSTSLTTSQELGPRFFWTLEPI